MKKLIYLLLLLPLAMLGGCHDDDDLPNVDVTVNYDNVVRADDGTIYVVAGTNLDIKDLSIKGVGGNAAIVSMEYWWNGGVFAWDPYGPFVVDINTTGMKASRNTLTLYLDIAQVDKTLAFGVISVPVVVVESADDLPAGTEPGAVSVTYNIGQKSKTN